MKFRQVENTEIAKFLTDPDLYMLFVENEDKIARKKVVKLPIETVVRCIADTRYMFGYFDSESTDGGAYGR